MRAPRLLALALVGLVLALAAPATTAQAATASTSVVQTITPGATPMTPLSVLKAVATRPGAVSNYLAGLIWGKATSAVQSIQAAGFQSITSTDAGPATQTGTGYSGTAVNCQESYSMGGGSWGTDVPLVRADQVRNSLYKMSDCAGTQRNVNITCYGSTGALTNLTKPSTGTVNGGRVTAPCGTQYGVPIAATIAPSDKSSYFGTDGGSWTSPDYASLIGATTVVSVEKTCAPIPPATTPAAAVYTANGPAGSGVTPALSCPAGTYPTSQRVYSHLANGAYSNDLGTASLLSTAAGSYPDCVYGSCALDVTIDGVKCVLTGAGCAEWWGNRAGTLAGKIACKWGNYSMPVDDCAPLANCYAVPLDTIGSTSSGCGIDPSSGDAGQLPKPIQDGKVYGGLPSASPAPTSTSGTSGSDGTNGSNAPAPQVNVTVNPTIIVPTPQDRKSVV